MRVRSCCARVLSSRLTIIAASLGFCVLVDKSQSHWGAGSADRTSGEASAQIKERDGGLPRPKEEAGVGEWFAWRQPSVAKKERGGGGDGTAHALPGPQSRLAQLVLASPRYAINAAKATCSPDGPAVDGPEAAARRPLVLIWVYSAPANVEARARVRETWGSVRKCEGYAIRVVFFLGLRAATAGDDTVADRLLADENDAHGDIVQDVSYVDSYANLSLKGASGLRWMVKHCSEASFAVKVDDDTLVSPFALVRYLQSADLGRDMACKMQIRVRPQRKQDKWFEDPVDFPGRVYPIYCQGFAYIFSLSTAQQLERAIGKTRVPRMEDVYVTGVLAESAVIGHQPLPKGAWMLAFPDGYERAIDNQTDVIFVSDTFIPSRVDYFWRKQKEVYKWKA